MRIALWLLAAALNGCGSPGGGGEEDAASECQAGTTCVPFDRGCSDSGVPVECGADGESWIDLAACGAGQACDPLTGSCECGPCEVIADGVCRRAGAGCAAGWIDDGECGCEPLVEPCADDEIGIIGGGCDEVGARDDCGVGTWGNIPVDTGTIYVDASYTAPDADGTETRPFPSMQAAIDAAPASTTPITIAVAAGTYDESVTSRKRVSIQGRCPSMVTVFPPVGAEHGVRLETGGSSVAGMTVEGGGYVRRGIHLHSCPNLEVRDVVVRSTLSAGLYCLRCGGVADHVTVMDTDPGGTDTFGDAILAGSDTGATCSLTVRNADVRNADRHGVLMTDCDIEITRSRFSVVGSSAIWMQASLREPSAVLRENLVFETGGQGIVATITASDFGPLTLERNRVLDTTVGSTAPLASRTAVSVSNSAGPVTFVENHVSGSGGAGVALVGHGEHLLVSRNLVEDTADASLTVDFTTAVEVSSNTTRGSVALGIWVTSGADAAITGNSVSGVAIDPADGLSVGIGLSNVSTATVSTNEVREASDGIDLNDTASATMSGNLVRAGRIALTALSVDDDSEYIIVENRVVDAPVGVAVGPCVACRVTIAGNLIGPLTLGAYDSMGNHLQAGVSARDVGSLILDANLLVMDPSGQPGLWSSGVNLVNVGGSVSANHLTGAGSASIALETLLGGPDLLFEIAGNTVSGGSGVGIYVSREGVAAGTVVSGNRIAGIAASVLPSGHTYGDGIAVVDTTTAGAIVSGNELLGNGRAGLFASNSVVEATANSMLLNAFGMAWQDGAVVSNADNTVECNGSDQPFVDGGLDVPEPPLADLPP